MAKLNAPISMILALFMIATPLSVFVGITSASESVAVPFAGGSGTVGDPYIIENVWELQNMSLDLGANYSLGNDIDASITTGWNAGAGFEPVGIVVDIYDPPSNSPFTGTLDGNGYAISNLFINRPGVLGVALFAGVENSVISDLELLNADITGGDGTAGLAGGNLGIINNVKVTGTITGDGGIGGLTGLNWGTITDCESGCDVTSSSSSAGGLVGANRDLISKSFATGDVSGLTHIGGLVGYNDGTGALNGQIVDCYATGDASALSIVGGLLGDNDGGNADVIRCYATGSVSGFSDTGGLVGRPEGASTVSDSFYDSDTTGQSDNTGKGVPKTTIEMMTYSTFSSAGWDFYNTWKIDEGNDYPRLKDFPIEIWTLTDLQNMNLNLSADYVLMNDIDASLTSGWVGGFDPVGDNINGFWGTFNGQNFTISNLYIDRPAESYIGLFGQINTSSSINYLNMVNVSVNGYSNVGGLVGYMNGGGSSISYCYASGDVVGVNNDIGGLLGTNSFGVVSNCYATGAVTGNDNVGGLVGRNINNIISNSYATGSVNYLGEPVAHWRMDKTAWTGAIDEVVDSSSNGNHGTAENGVTTVPGKFGNAGDFDGVNQRVNVPDSPSLNITKEITVSVWINTLGSSIHTIVGKDDDGPGGRSWHLCTQGGLMRFNVWTPTETMLVGTIPVNTGTWRHVVATYDGNDMSIYVDGVLDVSTPKTGDIADIVEPVQIGCMDNNWHFDGLIDDLRIYDRALSPDEILKFQCINAGGLVGYNSGIINNCYSSGNIIGNSSVGGFVGYDAGGTVTNSFWDNETSGLINSAGPEIGLNTADMMNNFTFINAGWDFSTTWFSVNSSTRPFLRMEHSTEISNSHQLQLMQMDLAADYELANDIDLSDIVEQSQMWGTNVANGKGFSPVGNNSVRFAGSLEGNGYTIDGLYINRPTVYYNHTGLFGANAIQADFMNTTLDNVNITGYMYVGGITGMNVGGRIDNCAVSGKVNSNWQMVGGVAGYSTGIITHSMFDGNITALGNYVGGITSRNSGGGEISNCTVYGDIDASAWLGGITGENYALIRDCHSEMNINGMGTIGGLVGDHPAGEINNSSASGSVTASMDNSGGFVGYSEAPIHDSYATGQTSGDSYVGGFAGQGFDIIMDCYATGDVIGTDYEAGGFIGRNNDVVMNCFSTGDVNGDNTVGGFVGRTEDTIINCSSTGDATGTDSSVGGFAGRAYETISNCSSTGNAIGIDNIGGFVGYYSSYLEMITNCSSTGNTNGVNDVGGFVGYNMGDIARSYSIGDAIGTGDNVGGFIGNNTYFNVPPMLDGSVTDCYSWGNASGDDNIGGFIGFNDINAEITNCYSIGIPSGNSYVGGFAGLDINVINDCFWDTEASGLVISDAGTGQTTSEMMQLATFTNWDFTTVWGIYEQVTYPFLQAMPYTPSADLELIMASSPAFTQVGNPVIYYVNITNNGPDSATNVNVTLIETGADMIYEGNNQSADTTFWGTGFSWEIVFLGAGEIAWLQINLTANESGVFDLAGTSVSDITDPNTGNNDASGNVTMNAQPVAANDTRQTTEDDIIYDWAPGVLMNDNDLEGDSFEIISHEDSDYGATINLTTDGNLTYDPTVSATIQALHNGELLYDTFNYTIRDARGGEATATITVEISGNEGTPTANNDTFTIAEDSGENLLDVLANDVTDEENDDFTISQVGLVHYGTLTISTDGKNLTYEQTQLNYTGYEVFSYWISDGTMQTSASVNLTITPVNDAPVIDTANVLTADVGTNYSVDYNATDAELDTLTWCLTTNATWLTMGVDGILNGTPVSGIYLVNITVDDGNGGIDWTSFTLTVTGSGTTAPVDTDGDGTPDDQDDFPTDANETTDSDGDGVGDNGDAFPNDATESVDTDGDGTGDNSDAFPTDPDEDTDTDDDGIGNNADEDDDGDGIPDSEDDDPLNPVDDGADDDTSNNTWLYIIIILVIVGIVAAVLVMRPKSPKSVTEAPVEESIPEEAAPEEIPEEAAEPEIIEE